MKHGKQQQSHSLVSHHQTQLDNCYRELQHLPRPNRRRLQKQFKTTLGGVALALVLGHNPEAMATTINVTTTDPAISVDGNCSLKEAIINANTDIAAHGDCAPGSGADIIVLSGGTYSLLTLDNIGTGGLNNGLPQIISPITIQGNGATIERDTAATDDFRLFEIRSGGDLTLEKTIVSGGNASVGGAIRNYSGNLSVIETEISNNTSVYGGGIFNYGGTATLTNSTVSYNSVTSYGGGIFNYSGYSILIDSAIIGNYSNSSGGGVFNLTDSTSITNSTISGNNTNGYGGGFLSLTGSSTLTNSTVSGNNSNGYGGGIANDSATLTLANNIISGNTASFAGNEVANQSGLIADAHNIFGHNGLIDLQAFYGFTPGLADITATSDGTNPTALASILDPVLADNGGPTQTHALVLGSPALDTVPAASCSSTQDQRGEPRPVDGGAGVANCDSGAFELNVCGTTYTLSNNQWRQISLPCAPPAASNTAADIFGDDGLGVYGADWILWSYNPITNNYDNPGLNGILQQGVGYWMIYLGAGSVELDMPAGSTPTPTTTPAACHMGAAGCFTVPLATTISDTQWNMIGYPFPVNRVLGDTRVTTTTASCDSSIGCTLDVANTNDLVENLVFTYNGATYNSIDTTGNFDPWMGYWQQTKAAAEVAKPVNLLIPNGVAP